MKLFFDLHLHSCLSACADEDMTPANLAAMCALAGIQVAALTDHNTTGNCAAFSRAAARHGILAIPGMELTTAEEIHVLCLLPDLNAAEAFGNYIYGLLPDIPNNKRIFGAQIYMDGEDGVLGEEPRLLSTAAAVGINQVAGLLREFGGVSFPAHINRPSNSLFSNLGFWDETLGFPLAERSGSCPPDFFARHPELGDVPIITGSDAHRLDQIMDAAYFMEVYSAQPAEILDWIRRGGR